MDEDTKKRLDGLVLKLQRKLMALGRPAVSANLSGQSFAYDMTIQDINKFFDTRYVADYHELEEHFRKKPLERR